MAQEKSYGQQRLEAAIRTMQEAVERAGREANREGWTDLQRASAVQHALVWGMANAWQEIESCIRQSEEDLRDEISVLKTPDPRS